MTRLFIYLRNSTRNETVKLKKTASSKLKLTGNQMTTLFISQMRISKLKMGGKANLNVLLFFHN